MVLARGEFAPIPREKLGNVVWGKGGGRGKKIMGATLCGSAKKNKNP